MTGADYANLIAAYILENFADRGVTVYREVNIGKSIIGKNRRIDVLVLCEQQNEAFAIECKYQETHGTVDEKIPYALEDMKAMQMGGCVAYAGQGFSVGVLHMLQASEMAAYCLPDAETLRPGKETLELDHQLALHFRWWNLLVRDRKAYERPA